MYVRDQSDEWVPILDLCRTTGVVEARGREQPGDTVGDNEQDELSPIEERARIDDFGADGCNEKVALVQKSLRAGIYSVSARAVASKMVDALFSPRPKR